jgi:hypothetical protein
MQKRRLGSAFFILLVWLYVLQAPTFGQPSPESERQSLAGVGPFSLIVDLEAPVSVQSNEALDPGRIHAEISAIFRDAGLEVRSIEPGREMDNLPYLYVHINLHDAGEGIYPFTVQVRFYQAVQLSGRGGTVVAGSTWEAGNVGIVSSDMLHMVSSSAINAAYPFIDDFRSANP